MVTLYAIPRSRPCQQTIAVVTLVTSVTLSPPPPCTNKIIRHPYQNHLLFSVPRPTLFEGHRAHPLRVHCLV